MAATGNRAIVERFIAASAARDHDTQRALAAPDLRVSEAASLPFGGEHVGLEAFRRLARQVFGMWDDTRLTVDRVLADGDTVVVLARLQGRSSGCAVEMPIAEIWELQDGRIHSIQPYYQDTHRLLEMLRNHAREDTGGTT